MGSCNKQYKTLYKRATILIVRRCFLSFFCVSEDRFGETNTGFSACPRRNNPNLGSVRCFGLIFRVKVLLFLTASQCVHSGLSEVSGYFQSTARPLLAQGDLFQCCILLAAFQVAPV